MKTIMLQVTWFAACMISACRSLPVSSRQRGITLAEDSHHIADQSQVVFGNEEVAQENAFVVDGLQEDMEHLQRPRRQKRAVYNLIPARPKSEEMLMAKLVGLEAAMKKNEAAAEHKRRTRTRRKLMRLLRELLKEEMKENV